MIYLVENEIDWGRFISPNNYYIFDVIEIPEKRCEEMIRVNRCRTFIGKHEVIGMFGTLRSRNQITNAPEKVELKKFDKIILIRDGRFFVFSFRQIDKIGESRI